MNAFQGSVRCQYEAGPPSEDEVFREEIIRQAELFIAQRENSIDGTFLYSCLFHFIHRKLTHDHVPEIERVPNPQSEKKNDMVRRGTSEHAHFIFQHLVYEWKIMEPLLRAYPPEKAVTESHVVLETLKEWCAKQLSRFTSTGQQEHFLSHYQ